MTKRIPSTLDPNAEHANCRCVIMCPVPAEVSKMIILGKIRQQRLKMLVDMGLNPEFFTEQDRARLRFLRWLVDRGDIQQ